MSLSWSRPVYISRWSTGPSWRPLHCKVGSGWSTVPPSKVFSAPFSEGSSPLCLTFPTYWPYEIPLGPFNSSRSHWPRSTEPYSIPSIGPSSIPFSYVLKEEVSYPLVTSENSSLYLIKVYSQISPELPSRCDLNPTPPPYNSCFHLSLYGFSSSVTLFSVSQVLGGLTTGLTTQSDTGTLFTRTTVTSHLHLRLSTGTSIWQPVLQAQRYLSPLSIVTPSILTVYLILWIKYEEKTRKNKNT